MSEEDMGKEIVMTSLFFFFHFYAQYDEKFNSRFKDDETIIKWSIKLDERVAGEKGLKSFPV